MFGIGKKQERKQKKEKDTVIRCTIWNTETQHKSGAGRAVVGGLMFGTVGAIAGSASKRDKEYTTFCVEYKSGRIDFPRVETGGMLYQMYISLMQQLERGGNNVESIR